MVTSKSTKSLKYTFSRMMVFRTSQEAIIGVVSTTYTQKFLSLAQILKSKRSITLLSSETIEEMKQESRKLGILQGLMDLLDDEAVSCDVVELILVVDVVNESFCCGLAKRNKVLGAKRNPSQNVTFTKFWQQSV
ncbi:hypothetical protein Tco_0309556 [Tanacetum coccineum]